MGLKQDILVVVFSFVLIINLNVLSGESVFNNNFNEVYSLGEKISVNFSIWSSNYENGFFELFLVCSDEVDFLLEKKYLELLPNQKRIFNLEFPAIGSGECFLKLFYNGRLQAQGSEFEINPNILIDFKLNNKYFSPGDLLVLNGSAEGSNGLPVDGFLVLSVGDFINKTLEVKKGQFSDNLPLNKDLAPGEYIIRVIVFNKDLDGDILNFGADSERIYILSKPSKVLITVPEIVSPPDSVSFSLSLLDQAGNHIFNKSLLIKVFDPNKDLRYQKEIIADQNDSYFFESDALKGAWEVIGYYGNLSSLSYVYILENPRISGEIINLDGKSYYRALNIGNVPYHGVKLIRLNNLDESHEIPLNLNLGLGEETLFPLDFDGVYNISIDDNYYEDYYLTGAAISLSPLVRSRTYIILILFIICVLIGYFLFRSGFFKKSIFSKGLIRKIFSPFNAVVLFFRNRLLSNKKSTKNKFVFMLVFNLSSPLGIDILEKKVNKFGHHLNKVSDSFCYVLFYGTDFKVIQGSLLNFSREIKNELNSRGINVSIAINSSEFRHFASFIREFVSVTRRMALFLKNGIIVPKHIYQSLNVGYVQRFPKLKIQNFVSDFFVLKV